MHSLDGHAAGEGIALVKGAGDQLLEQQRDKERDQHVQRKHQPEVAGGHRQDAAKKIAHEIGLVARRDVDQDDARGHAKGPQHADDRVCPLARAQFHQPHGQRGREAKANRTQQGIDAQVETQADAAVSGVGDAAAEKHHTTQDDQRAHDATGDTHQQAGQEGITKELELEGLDHACAS